MSIKKVSFRNKLAYGFGAVSFGTVTNGFDYFFLIFYSQILGVDAHLVGLALLIALIVDSLSDPIIGYLSDNTHSRWGRRHPFMYAAVIPVSVAYYFIWNPPASLSGNELFPFILVMAIGVRTLITLFEIPNSALIAEMTEDYDERTSILSYRFFFGWVAGVGIGFYAFTFLLVPTETIANGLFNIAGFGEMGLTAAVVIFIAILTSSIGTHNLIPYMNPPPSRATLSIQRIYREIFETLRNRSFIALFSAALMGAIGTGIAAGLFTYINSFFWGFSTIQVGQLNASIIISALIALLISPTISHRLGKKHAAIIIGLLAFTIMPITVVLRLLGVIPENGDPQLFPLMLIITVVDVSLIISYQTITTSMIADLVEDSEVQTGRRSEGIFFASMTFIKKFVQGFGVLMATTILTMAQFPAGAAPGEVPSDALFRLGAYYVPTVVAVWMLMIVFISKYNVSRETHNANLSKLGRNSVDTR